MRKPHSKNARTHDKLLTLHWPNKSSSQFTLINVENETHAIQFSGLVCFREELRCYMETLYCFIYKMLSPHNKKCESCNQNHTHIIAMVKNNKM